MAGLEPSHKWIWRRPTPLLDCELSEADHPEANACLLYGGKQRYRFGSIDVVPLDDGLAEMGERLA